IKRAFSLARPPGHHASFDQGKGFCIFNHAAIAARYAQNTYAMRNILILDWDVHHGDGTQNIFYHDPSIFYFSTHQINHYPFSGFADEKGADKEVRNIWNFPIYPTDQSREEVLSYFENTLPEIAKWIKPDLVIISCGFDGHEMDPLGGFNLTDQDFERLTKAAITVAEKYSSGRVVSILEGGYQLDALASASYQHLKALNEWKPYPES
ncbi:MAG: histone deacetylase, partial [Waddliaceae bacterium]